MEKSEYKLVVGSMVAFGMRLLHAELPHHLGRSQESLDRLYYILAVTQKVMYYVRCQSGIDGE